MIAEREPNMTKPFRSAEVLRLAMRFQKHRHGLDDYVFDEFMRLAVNGDQVGPAGMRLESAIVLCRLLFTSADDPLRPPRLGQPYFVRDTTRELWPNEPVVVYNGLPFLIVIGWSLGGLAERPTSYLAYCLQNGRWVDEPYEMPDPETHEAIAEDFIHNGPWNEPLDENEKDFLRLQVR